MDSDMLSSLLNDPETLQNAIKTVSELFSSGDTPTQGKPEYDPSAELMERALPVIGSIVQSGHTAIRPEKKALLIALKPFVSDEIAGEFDHAMRLVSMARMARTAIGQLNAKSEPSAETEEGEQSV